ncbi:MAG: PEP/pyruvate-binding domain-containing protein, partial [Acidobacteriota bacterium]
MSAAASTSDAQILWFEDIEFDDLPLVGGKNASLGELIKLDGINVPNGFAITTTAFKQFMEPLKPAVSDYLGRLRADNYRNVLLLEETSKAIRQLIESQPFDRSFEEGVAQAFEKLNTARNVAVRSSATAEDLPEASFAGQQDTFLNVSSLPDLFNKIKRCFSSLYTARAMSYRHEVGFSEDDVSLSVGVQEMVRADWRGISGVMFTIDTETGNQNLMLITPNRGLGEAIVQGEVKPDEVYVLRHSLRVIQNPLQLLDDARYSELAGQGLAIEDHYAKKYGRRVYMDIEWALDGETNELFILQARPETVHSRGVSYKRYFIVDDKKNFEVLSTGRPVGMRIGHGKANVLQDVSQMDSFKAGQVLVTRMTSPDWEPIMKQASAIVTDQGGRTCHAAIIAREM